MNPESDQFRDFSQSILIVNDELADPFSSRQILNPEEFNQKFQSLQIECERIQRITTHFEK
jgi:hypothetical protein